MKKSKFSIMPLFVYLLFVFITAAIVAAELEIRWWKGNLHTHTFWSDGRNYPEIVVEWYKNHGYHFLGLSDHDILSQGVKWIDVGKSEKLAPGILSKYVERFGNQWVEQRDVEGKPQVRLKPLGEYRCLFEESNRFRLIQVEEISDKAVHLGGVNLLEYVSPQGGANRVDAMQNNVNAVIDQREKTGQMIFPHVNYPNFGWSLTAEEIMQVQGEQFFEVYNGHPSVHNEGDELRASTERMWDIILTRRLAELNLPIMYGIATDDAHSYQKWQPAAANPGRGWIVVWAAYLTPESIIKAMEKGVFYSSTGIVLKEILWDKNTLTVEVQPQKDVSYTIQFIGTLKGYDTTSKEVIDSDGKPMRATHVYSDRIGKVLTEINGTAASYTLTGDELYVRAKVISSKLNETLSPKGNLRPPGFNRLSWKENKRFV